MSEHPQRCKTCDSCGHAEKTNSKTYPFKCLASEPIPMMVHEYCIGWFGYVGCASHSSTRPHPAPALTEHDMQYAYELGLYHGEMMGARKAREDECERIYGLFHEVERLHLNGMAYPDLYNEMVARIKFIHTEPLSKDGRKKESLQAQQAGDQHE